MLASAREAAARRTGARPSSAGRPSTRTSPAGTARSRPPLTPAQAKALEAALAARTAGSTTGRPARRPAPGRRGRPTAGKPARTSRRKPGSRRTEPGTGTRRWRLRLSLAALGLALPVLAGLVFPGTQATGTAAEPTGTPDLALTAHSRMTDGAARYRSLEQDLAARRAELASAQEAERAARARVAAERAAVGARAAALYRSTPESRHPLLTLDLDDPAAAPDVLHESSVAERADRDLERTVVRAGRAGTDLELAVHRVATAQAAVAAIEAQAAGVLADLRAEAGGLPADVAARLTTVGAVPVPAQEGAQQALRRWQDLLGTLAAAGIRPPSAASLADPAALPPGFSPALDGEGQPVPGVAWSVAGNRPVTVLPAETVAAVSSALAQVGKPYVPGGVGPDAYDCGGLAAGAWLLAGHAVPTSAADQWRTGSAVPLSQLQIGDLVFADGGSDVGIYLGEGQVVGASAATYQVGVRPLSDVTGAVRVTLAAAAQPNAALPAGTSGRSACGAVPPPPGPVSPAWGGWTNGGIPAPALCSIARGHALRCDAAAGYAALAEAFTAAFERPLCITDSYRSLAAQVTAFRTKPALAAVPGTSNHGWALAIDLCGGVNVAGTPQSAWMAANAGRFGFVQPDWARPGGEKPEPWHWEFGHLA
ncbi:hydrolase [Geodermatophilus sabuli]|uniref:Hydrolase n=1 Tax=Geodermatophilus sabuli TaxID=1564158 RepID=A0A7K3VZM7_9ACTN|nr:NlpC/P60 family protein [Geodermatophilus sabuli]NEK57850.1 hydrolase [Geodermatophilus sabuli]